MKWLLFLCAFCCYCEEKVQLTLFCLHGPAFVALCNSWAFSLWDLFRAFQSSLKLLTLNDGGDPFDHDSFLSSLLGLGDFNFCELFIVDCFNLSIQCYWKLLSSGPDVHQQRTHLVLVSFDYIIDLCFPQISRHLSSLAKDCGSCQIELFANFSQFWDIAIFPWMATLSHLFLLLRISSTDNMFSSAVVISAFQKVVGTESCHWPQFSLFFF